MILICSYAILSQYVWQHDKYEKKIARIKNQEWHHWIAHGILNLIRYFNQQFQLFFFCVLLWGTKSTSSSTECHDQNYHHDYNQELTCILYNATKISPQVALPIASRPNLCVFDIFNLECINAVISIFFRILQIWTSWHHRSFCIVCKGKLSSAPVL